MGYFIGTLLVFIFLFVGVFIYKIVNDDNWCQQLLSGNLKDEDLFTKIIKWLMY